MNNTTINKGGIFLYNVGTNQFLILLSRGATHNWSIPKGVHEASDKDFLHTAVRELWEETQISPSNLYVEKTHDLGFIEYGQNRKYRLFAFLYIINQKVNPLVFLCHENSKFKWVSLSEAKKFIFKNQFKYLNKIRWAIFKYKIKRFFKNIDVFLTGQ